MSSIVNKVKDALHPDKSSSTTHNTHSTTSGAPEGTYGPHSSRVANAADPRVDSDRDDSHNIGRTAGHGEYGISTGDYAYGAGVGSTMGTSANTTTGTTGTREGEYGPHSSRVANSLDPKIDSDLDGSRNAGAAYGGHPVTGTTGTDYAGTTGGSALGGRGSTTTGAGTREGEHGPHSSRVANVIDPRVDSDRDGSRNAGAAYRGHTTSTTDTHGVAGTGLTGVTGTHGAPTGTHGPHNSRVANAADPLVDSDRDGRANVVRHTAPGPTPNTAGPHKSDMLNKMDPRVDSDMDNSKTVGANKTYQ